MILDRRNFLLCSGAAVMAESRRSAIRFSLSVRVAEEFSNKEKSTMTLDQLIALARAHRFEALCMRASQGGIHTPAAVLKEMRRKIGAAGLRVSMVTGDFAVPSNNDQGPALLRNIAPHLELAETLGADLIRVCMKKEEDIAAARRASDQARERTIRLAHQSHCASLFETVENSLRVLKAVGRSNFGIIYEPANWMIAGEDYGAATLRRLQPYLFNVYVQNHRLNPNGSAAVETWRKGKVPLDHIGIWEKGGVDYDAVAAALREIGYQGYVTVHQAFGDVMPVEDAVRRSREHLTRILTG
jgi:sugar phosphate isomerase/epimerase